MMIHEITEQVGRYKARKRKGRGEGSGIGGTSGRGHKGARSRSGWSQRRGYEGGQVPLFRRLPKRGFNNAAFASRFHIVNLKALERALEDGTEVTPEVLVKARLIRDASLPVKVLGEGKLTKRFAVTAACFSAAARQKIEGAGGSVTVAGGTPSQATES
jgi:large subunit ribosomal protein L15